MIKLIVFVLILSLGGSFSSIGNVSDESLKSLMLIQADFRFTDQPDIFGLPIMLKPEAVSDLNYDEMMPIFAGAARSQTPIEKNLVTSRQKAKLRGLLGEESIKPTTNLILSHSLLAALSKPNKGNKT